MMVKPQIMWTTTILSTEKNFQLTPVRSTSEMPSYSSESVQHTLRLRFIRDIPKQPKLTLPTW